MEKTLRGRRGRPELAELVFDALCSGVNHGELLSGLESSLLPTRRLCIRALFASEAPDIELALACLDKEREPFLRALLFQGIVKAGAQVRDAVLVLLDDTFPPNRALALRYLRDHHDAELLPIALRLLMDKNAGIRALAREIVSTHQPDTDFRSFYLDALQDGNASVILGLGEVGTQSDAALAAPFLVNDVSAMVSAAMATVMRLDAPRYASIVTGMLRDERLHIVKMAQRLVIKYRRADFATVKAVLEETPYVTTQRRCVQLLYTASSKWERLIYMLEAAASDNVETQRVAWHCLSRWCKDFNKSYVLPSPQQSEQIEMLLNQQP
ncbi:hypothetical protein LJC74_09190, partial [Eubacteriales bacterium OttesenSCG-928-A19]|nr:hypothetical protein [Eubacteriales bacterium OttesenSCG-928-A19]